MHVELVVDGKPRRVEVDLAAGTARVDDHAVAFRVLRSLPDGVELEIEGERYAVSGWPEGLERPMAGLALNGERVSAELVGRSVGPEPAPRAAPVAPTTSAPPAPSPTGPGTAVQPPMPGKVLELRVHDGEKVQRGQVLLVIEAMKMRNEIVAPTDGVVAELSARVGTNVPARSVLLRIVPA